jgi:hypothetical protein
MKFRLSSLLLTTTIAAIAIGWYLDRASFDRRYADLERWYRETIDEHWAGVHTMADARRLIVLSRNYKKHDTNAALFSFDNDLIWAMMDLWHHENAVNIAIDQDDEFAVTHGHDILDILGCDTADEFFALAKQTPGYNGENTEIFPEIHESDSAEYKSFRDFVDRSAKTTYVTEWGW